MRWQTALLAAFACGAATACWYCAYAQPIQVDWMLVQQDTQAYCQEVGGKHVSRMGCVEFRAPRHWGPYGASCLIVIEDQGNKRTNQKAFERLRGLCQEEA